MSNLLPDEQTTIQTYDEIADIWVSQYNQPNFWDKEIERFHKLLAKGKILEIGAGGVRDAKELLALGYEYVGTDISAKLLAEAKKQLPDQKFYQQSVYDLSFPAHMFDGFWASKVLLHIPKARIDKALTRIKSVIKPGAIGFISMIAGRGEELRDETWDDGSHHQRYFAYYLKPEFSEVLNRNKFELVDYKYRVETRRLKWHCFFVKSR